MSTTDIYVAKSFSRFPAGRFTTDGPNSGERFRNDFLIPSLVKGDKLRIYLDDVLGYGSSFLEEAFGGLVRDHKYSGADLRKAIELISIDESLIEEVWQYIDEESDRLSMAKHS